MPRWIILAILLLVVLGRSAVFILFPESYFDSDQAIVGAGAVVREAVPDASIAVGVPARVVGQR